MTTLGYRNRCKKDVPGQVILLHSSVCSDTPGQANPPPDGEGELHSRIRVCDPFPQVTLQSPYSPQSDHPPLTKHIENRDQIIK